MTTAKTRELNVYYEGYIAQQHESPSIWIPGSGYGGYEENIINQRNYSSRFCLELNATIKELKFMVNYQRIFQRKIIPFEMLNGADRFTTIQIEGKHLLTQAELFSVGIESIKPDMNGGDLLKWNASEWGASDYSIKRVPTLAVFQPTLIFIPVGMSFSQADHTCQLLGKEGEIAEIDGNLERKNLMNLYSQYKIEDTAFSTLYIPFQRHEDATNFTHFYRRTPVNYKIEENDPDKKLDCADCSFVTNKCSTTSCTEYQKTFFCQFPEAPLLEIRGLCANSPIDNYFYPSIKLGEYVWIGDDTNYIRYDNSTAKWILRTSEPEIWGTSDAPLGMT